MKRTYQKLTILLIILLIGGVAFFVYQYGLKDQANQTSQNNQIDEQNDIQIEGHLYKDGDQFGLMGWKLSGEMDFDPFVDQKIVVVGQQGEGEDEIIVSQIIKMDDTTEVKTEEKIVYGILKEDNVETATDRHYKIKNLNIRTDQDLSEYVDKEVVALVDVVISKDIIEEHGDLIEIHIPYTIQGTLKVLSKEDGHFHYQMGKYNIHSTMDITRYEGDFLKLLVFDGQHGSQEENMVTLVKVK